MARTIYVTRTIQSTKVSALCIDITTAEPSTEVFNVAGTFKSEDKLLKTIKSAYDTDNFKVVSITSSEVVETLYGLPIDEFMNHAVRLDEKTRRPIKDDANEVVPE